MSLSTKTRPLMISSALFLGVLGVGAWFLPQEIIAYAGVSETPFTVALLQGLGALSLGFAALDWMARGVVIGGIYARPLALGNFLHFAAGTGLLLKALAGGGPLLELGVGTVAYGLFALWFGAVLFSDPTRARRAGG